MKTDFMKSNSQEEERQAEALYAFLRGEMPITDPDVPQAEAALAGELRDLAQGMRAAPQFEAHLRGFLAAETERKKRRQRMAAAGWVAVWASLAVVLLLGVRWAIQNALPGSSPLAAGAPQLTAAPGMVAVTRMVTVTPLPTGVESGARVSYTVQPGDSLLSIAKKFNSTVEDIMRENKIGGENELFVGQALTIRANLATPPGEAMPSPSPVAQETNCVEAQHTVQQGDTLFSIAMTYEVEVEAILLANQMTEAVIYVGQVLRIPCSPAVQETPVSVLPTPVPLPEPLYYLSEDMPDTVLALQAAFPDAPQDMAVYQRLPWPALTVDDARLAAEKMGVPGGVFQPSASTGDENSSTILYITDGFERLEFIDHIYQYSYAVDRSALANTLPVTLPMDEQVRRAQEFLQQKGWLDFPYRVDTYGLFGGTVNFLPLLDGYPVRFGLANAMQMTVVLDSQGQVRSVYARRLNFEALGRYGVISAQEAWQKLLQEGEHVESGSGGSIPPAQSWQRSYPFGETISVYGRVEVLQPADGQSSRLVFLDGVPLSGNLEGIEAVDASKAENADKIVKISGQFQPGEHGERSLHVDSWLVTQMPWKYLRGEIHRQDGQAYLVTQDEGPFLLPDLPADAPNGKTLMATGIMIGGATQTLEWSWLGPFGGGGGGGGGGEGFYDLDLSGAAGAPATPLPEVTPIPAERVDRQMFQVIIDKIELVYYTPDYMDPEVESPLYAQPAWRFAGHYADGTWFEFLVQALQPQYLK